MELDKSFFIAASGMKSQSLRLRVIAENIANADSVAQTPEGEPYRRKLVTFANTLDRELGAELVSVKAVRHDMSEFGQRYQPGHPAANEQGYIQTPNVSSLMEVTDMREAQRSYEANLKIIESTRTMLTRTIDILR